jgi:hypothetical protein
LVLSHPQASNAPVRVRVPWCLKSDDMSSFTGVLCF